jgi:hypothetical protein
VSPLTGQRRDGFVCVAAFQPPDASSRARAWEEANRDRFGPHDEWQIDIGRAVGGDFYAFWVPEQHASHKPA